jgi:hypothetical protein
MASIRELKKEVEAQIYEVISDCFAWKALHGEEKTNEVVNQILEDAVALRNDLIHRINNPVKTEKTKELKAHYDLVSKDLSAGVDQLFTRLSSVTAKKKK